MSVDRNARSLAASVSKKLEKKEAQLPMINTIVDVNIPYKAKNAAEKLNVPTSPEGGQQPTHPSVVYFPDGWRGWRYWMAHTPFPNGAGAHENPHIVVSQDGINWEFPPGITNPIFPQPARGFYSDVDLVYHTGEDRLYLFWRYVESSWTVEHHLVTVSDDGITWSPKRETLTDSRWMLSPSIVYDGEIWHMWYAGAPDMMKPIAEQTITVSYRTAQSPFGPWSAPMDTNLTGLFLRNNDVGVWHIDVNKYGEEYHMLICSDNDDLYLATSTKGKELTWNYNKMAPILTKSGLATDTFDASKIYRSCGLLVREGSGYRYKIWYGAVGKTNNWSIGYTELILGPSALQIKPRRPDEQALNIEGRKDQTVPLIEANAMNFNQKILSLRYNNADRLFYELSNGGGLRLPVEGDQLMIGSDTGIKARFLANPSLFYLQVGKSSSDVDAVLRISRYQGTSNIKSFEVHADTSLFKGDVELDNAAKGAILKSPDGARWRVQVGNDGVLKTTKL